MVKTRKNCPNDAAVSSDSDTEQPSKIQKIDVDQFITDLDKIPSLDFLQCFDIISTCCSIQDKRSLSKYANVISTAADNMKKIFEDLSNNVDINADDTKSILMDIKNKLSTPFPYSSIVNKPKALAMDLPKKLSNEFSLFVTAKNGTASSVINSNVNQIINDSRKTNPCLKINKVIRNNKGNIIKVPNNDDLATLLNHFQNRDDIRQIADVYIPKPRDPTIVLKKVNKFTDSKDLPSILSRVNEHLSGRESEIKVLFEFRSNLYFRDVVLRVSPKVYELISKNDILYTDFEAIKFQHRVFVKQCKFCFQFNSHKSNECPRKNKPICADCGEEGIHHCSKINKCSNCSSYFKNNAQPDLLCHRPNHEDCPLYKRKIERIIQQTAFKHVDIPEVRPLTTTIELASQQSSSSLLTHGSQN
ncbi:hypothetical protein BLA29_002801 [Euroglyphus maynei]|uniref:Uncharacterized protein n=1 Tax=Euroglyphus maynei TaxID=6958 RepID=A0A1Y3B7E8_EURMA|nr:hypothetical protein BLA29_002801 [Euroglyphus maynei]